MSYDPLWKEYFDFRSDSIKISDKIENCKNKNELNNLDLWIKDYTIDLSTFPSFFNQDEFKISKIKSPSEQSVEVAMLDIKLSGDTSILKKAPNSDIKLKDSNTGIILEKKKISIFIEKNQKNADYLKNVLNDEKSRIISNMASLKETIENYNNKIEAHIRKKANEKLEKIEEDENFFK